MKNAAVASLADAECFQGVAEYHPTVATEGLGTLQPGAILDDRFLITEAISRSGTAMLFKAQDLHAGSAEVALKVPHADSEQDAGFLARFEQEQEIGLRLSHPFILKFIPIATARSRPYLVTEYVRGCTLGHLLEAMSPLPESDVRKIGSLICEALDYLHGQGVVHGDLKPENIMIGCDGTLRLLDFGLASSHRARSRAVPAGTPDYMAPEQVEGRRTDARTDVYSVGAMLYEMLTGRPPFDGDNPLIVMNARTQHDPEPLREVNPAVSPEAERIVLRALERRPSSRQRSANALGAELANIADASPEWREDRKTRRIAGATRGWLVFAMFIAGVVVGQLTPSLLPEVSQSSGPTPHPRRISP